VLTGGRKLGLLLRHQHQHRGCRRPVVGPLGARGARVGVAFARVGLADAPSAGASAICLCRKAFTCTPAEQARGADCGTRLSDKAQKGKGAATCTGRTSS